MTLFPFGTFMCLVRLARTGSRGAVVLLALFVVGLLVVIAASAAGNGVGVLVGGVMFGVGAIGARRPVA